MSIRIVALLASGLVACCLPAQASEPTPPSSLSGAMSKLWDSAKGGSDVMKVWSAFQSGKKEAAPKIVALANDGNAAAQNIAGYMFDNGDGVRRDSKKAAAYFSAAAKDIELARYNLGLLYLLGRGVSKDETRAVQLFEQAPGVEQACVHLAVHYLQKGDQEASWKWANTAANRGNPTGFYLLGRLYFERRQFKEARNWLFKAASASEPNSPILIAKIHEIEGRGDRSSLVNAASWHIIHSSMHRKDRGAGAVATNSYGLNDGEYRKAVQIAEKWLETHANPKKVEYKKTLAEIPKKFF